MRHMSPRIFEKSPIRFRSHIVRPVTICDTVIDFEFIWHCRRWITSPVKLLIQTRRRVPAQPLKMLLTAMLLLWQISVDVLFTEFKSQICKPYIMRQRFRRPQNRWMICCVLLIAPITSTQTERCLFTNKICTTIYVMGCVENLCIFKNHLHNMLVAVPSSTATRMVTEKEDIHLVGAYPTIGSLVQFFRG